MFWISGSWSEFYPRLAHCLKQVDKFLPRLWLIPLLFLGYGGWAVSSAIAQTPLEWMLPGPISSDTEYAFRPVLVADASGTVHAFWAGVRIEQSSELAAILYSRYRAGEWTPPVDILVSPNGQNVFGLRSLVDNEGRLHLFWSAPGADSPFGPIYHSWAPVNEAGLVISWQPPTQLADGTYEGDVALDPQGRLHLVYASVSDSMGICRISSEDNGDTWGPPTCLPHFASLRDEEHETRPRLAIDSKGTLHVVWVLDDYSPASKLRYSGRGVYYARSTDGGISWSDMIAVEEVDGREMESLTEQPEWPNIAVDHQDRAHIVWISGIGQMQRYHQWSNDSGVTWSTPQVAISSTFYNGWMGLAVDGDGVLHFVTAGSEGVTYSRWTANTGWMPRVQFKGEVGEAHYVSLVVALGNELHVVWQDHGYSQGFEFRQGEKGRIMHTMMPTGGQRMAPRLLPTARPPVQPTPTLSIKQVVDSVVTPTPKVQTLVSVEASEPSNPANPIVMGLLPAIIFIGFIILLRIRRN